LETWIISVIRALVGALVDAFASASAPHTGKPRRDAFNTHQRRQNGESDRRAQGSIRAGSRPLNGAGGVALAVDSAPVLVLTKRHEDQ
jgi:hypothetical protein